jgi:hypothetical protein
LFRYTVNVDCTGDATINLPNNGKVQLKFVLGDRGNVIHTIVYSLTPPGAPAAVPANIHSDAEKL